jgi:hypothetical protein
MPAHGIPSLSSIFSIPAGHRHKPKMLKKLSSPSPPHHDDYSNERNVILGATVTNSAYKSLPVSGNLTSKYLFVICV